MIQSEEPTVLSYYQRNKEARLLYQKQWSEKNPEKRLAEKKRYREAHREQRSAYMKAYNTTRRKPLTEEQKKEKNERTRLYFLTNRERLSKRARFSHYKRKYNLTEAEHLRLLKKQRYCCAICAIDVDTLAEKSLTLAVDHCHETGKVRGLLCPRCNVALGILGDSFARITRAYRYLKRFQSKE